MKIWSACESRGWIASSTTRPVIQTRPICAACEPTASTIETTRETRYGFRKPSSRANVRRYGEASGVTLRV